MYSFVKVLLFQLAAGSVASPIFRIREELESPEIARRSDSPSQPSWNKPASQWQQSNDWQPSATHWQQSNENWQQPATHWQQPNSQWQQPTTHWRQSGGQQSGDGWHQPTTQWQQSDDGWHQSTTQWQQPSPTTHEWNTPWQQSSNDNWQQSTTPWQQATPTSQSSGNSHTAEPSGSGVSQGQSWANVASNSFSQSFTGDQSNSASQTVAAVSDNQFSAHTFSDASQSLSNGPPSGSSQFSATVSSSQTGGAPDGMSSSSSSGNANQDPRWSHSGGSPSTASPGTEFTKTDGGLAPLTTFPTTGEAQATLTNTFSTLAPTASASLHVVTGVSNLVPAAQSIGHSVAGSISSKLQSLTLPLLPSNIPIKTLGPITISGSPSSTIQSSLHAAFTSHRLRNSTMTSSPDSNQATANLSQITALPNPTGAVITSLRAITIPNVSSLLTLCVPHGSTTVTEKLAAPTGGHPVAVAPVRRYGMGTEGSSGHESSHSSSSSKGTSRHGSFKEESSHSDSSKEGSSRDEISQDRSSVDKSLAQGSSHHEVGHPPSLRLAPGVVTVPAGAASATQAIQPSGASSGDGDSGSKPEPKGQSPDSQTGTNTGNGSDTGPDTGVGPARKGPKGSDQANPPASGPTGLTGTIVGPHGAITGNNNGTITISNSTTSDMPAMSCNTPEINGHKLQVDPKGQIVVLMGSPGNETAVPLQDFISVQMATHFAGVGPIGAGSLLAEIASFLAGLF